MPQPVRVACALVWTAAALGLLLNVALMFGYVTLPGAGQGLLLQSFSALFSFALLGLLAVKMRAGRNWARWLFAVLVALGVLGILMTTMLAGQLMNAMPAIVWISGAVNTALQLVALFLVFRGEGAAWFRSS